MVCRSVWALPAHLSEITSLNCVWPLASPPLLCPLPSALDRLGFAGGFFPLSKFTKKCPLSSRLTQAYTSVPMADVTIRATLGTGTFQPICLDSRVGWGSICGEDFCLCHPAVILATCKAGPWYLHFIAEKESCGKVGYCVPVYMKKGLGFEFEWPESTSYSPVHTLSCYLTESRCF